MNLITQPITVTDMRRDPKELLERVKKEGVVPILVHGRFEAAVISIEELTKLHDLIKDLKHDLFAEGVLAVGKDYKQNGGCGPFDTVDSAMEFLNESPVNDENSN